MRLSLIRKTPFATSTTPSTTISIPFEFQGPLKLLGRDISIEDSVLLYYIPVSKDQLQAMQNLPLALDSLHRNLWVQAKVDADLATLGPTKSKKDRKLFSKLKRETYYYYTRAFEEMQRPKVAEETAEIEHGTETDSPELTITPTPEVELDTEYASTYQETTGGEPETLDLGTKELQRYTQAVPEHMQRKVASIVSFLRAHPDPTQALDSVSYAIRYNRTLPFVKHQYCTMSFGDKEYPHCLKINLNKRDRLICYPTSQGIDLKFYTAQEYHNTRG